MMTERPILFNGAMPKPDVPLVRGGCYTEALVRKIVAEKVAAERERCAKLCEALVDLQAQYVEAEYSAGADECARRIRETASGITPPAVIG